MTRAALLADTSAAATTGAHKASRSASAHKNIQGACKDGGADIFPDVLASLADGPKETRGEVKTVNARRETKVSAEAGGEKKGQSLGAEELLASLVDDTAEADQSLQTSDDRKPADDEFVNLASLLAPAQKAAPSQGNGEEIGKSSSAATEVAGELAKAAQPHNGTGTKPTDAAMPDDAELAARLPEGKTNVAVLEQKTHFAPVQGTQPQQTAGAAIAGEQAKAQAPAAAIAARGEVNRGQARQVPATEPSEAGEAVASGGEDAGVVETIAPPAARAADDDQSAQPDERRPSAGAIQTTAAAAPDASLPHMPAPTRQVAAAVVAELTASSGRGATPVVTQVSETSTGSGSVLKVLHIKLEPETLGTVTVRMSLRDNAIEMKIEAQSAETADLINADRDALTGLLRASGYAIDVSMISTGRADTGFPAGSNQQPGMGQQQDQSAQNNRSAPDSGRQQPGARDDRGGQGDAQNRRGFAQDETGGALTRAGGGLYI